MSSIFNRLIYLFICAAITVGRSGKQVLWLPCQLVEEYVALSKDGHNETHFQYRDAGLQFGHVNDPPLNPQAITFLVTGSKVDLRVHVEGSSDQVQCELRRFIPEVPQVWAGPGARKNDLWFTCTLRHNDGLFTLISHLRHTPVTPPYSSTDRWSPIGDRDTLTTAVALMVLTRSPVMHVGLRAERRLHCQFSVDHRGAQLSVAWILQRRGERSTLFSYASQSGLTQGSGVGMKDLVVGDASLSLPLTKVTSEGTYQCSVSVAPLHANLDITLTIREPPRVSLNLDSTISLVEGEDVKAVCEATGYYPLDVDMEWLRESQEQGLIPEKLQNVLYSSHRHHQEGTYSLSAFFLLKARLQDSGSKYFCRVSHSSLRMPVRKSFTLTVTEPSSWWPVLCLCFILLAVALLCVLLPHLQLSKEKHTKKPY
ncbi:tapasin-related protein isoform X2 [Osmerus eperlanus]|uniref:tapasin-related protein isoform X2 n=1 Tax=Osmerus eperlanus TaxID=29151 RepID=UPI002E0F4114